MPCFQSVHKKTDTNTKCRKGSDEGQIYEKLSLALLAKRGYELSIDDSSNICNFTIGREVGIGREGKFDDVVFKYIDKDSTNNLIFVQIKHKQDDYQIDSEVLSAEASKAKGGTDGGLRRDFNLQKYFISFLNVKEELKNPVSEELVNGNLNYVVIFTNIGLNTEELNSKGFNLKEAPHDIIKLFSLKEPSLKIQELNYCHQLDDVSEDLRKIFKESSDLHRLARKLAQYVVWENYREKNILGIDESLIRHYHIALEREVIKKSDQVKNNCPGNQNVMTKQYCEAQFRDDFLNNDKSGSKQELRDALFQAIRELDESKKAASGDELKDVLKEVKLKVVPNFGKTKQKSKISLPCKWNSIKDEDITDFLKSLIFVVNQPRVKELEDIFGHLMQGTVVEGTSLRQVLDKIENAGPEFKKRIEKVLGIDQSTKYKEKWISGEKILDFIEEQKQLISISFIVSAMTLIYESEVMQYGNFIQCGKWMKSLNNFLSGNSKILCINTTESLLSSIKILQCLNTKKDYRAEKGRISICLDNLNNKGNKDSVLKVFELEHNNLLTIECRHTVNALDVEEFYYKLSNIIRSNPSKKILIIQQSKSTILAEKFRTDFQDKGLYVAENDSIDLKDFVPKEDPFCKHVLVFQGQEERVSLTSLTGINNWSSYVNYLSQEKFKRDEAIIDTATLLKILNNDEIEIGNKPLGTSSLDGAYATLYEELNTETVAKTLLSQNFDDNNTEDIYIMSGIKGLSKEEKYNKFIQYLKLANEIENITNQLGDVGSSNKIQIADDDFNDENFHSLCHTYPTKQIFWICVKHNEDEIKFFLQRFYNPKFYLKRKFKNVIIRKKIREQLIDKNLGEVFLFYCVNDQNELIDYLKIANKSKKEEFEKNCKNGKIQLFTLADDVEASFQEICKQNQSKNVHWLKLEEDQLIWCQSHGSLKYLHMYIDHKQNEASLVEEDNLIKQIKCRKVVLIADDPGMGKTSSLTRLYETKNDEFESFIETHWVVRINLKDHLHAIKAILLKNKDFDILNVVNFLSRVDSKLNHSLSKNLLKIALNKDKHFSKPLLLAFDGFDEVLEVDDRRKLMLLLNFLNNETAAKLWITTRLHFQHTLENELSTFAIEFDPMNDEAKITYVRKYLKDRLCLVLTAEKFMEFFANDEVQGNKRIQKYVDVFLYKMKSVFKSNACRFIGTPLQLYLMLEGSLTHFKNWIENCNENLDFNYLGNDVVKVYKTFIDRKYDIYFKKLDIRGYTQQKQNKFFLNQCNKDFAKSLILNSKQKKTLSKFKDIILSAGIIKAQDNNIEFIHATFRDYFAAKVFIHWIRKSTNELSNTTKQECLLKEIFKKPDYQVIRTFIDIKLPKISLSGENFKEYGKIVESMSKEEQTDIVYGSETLLHIAVKEGNSNIVTFLLNSLKEHGDILKKFLFSPNEYKKSALHLACELDNIEIVRILIDAAAGISKDALQEFIYLCKDNDSNALDEAVLRSDNVEILKELLKRTNSKLDLIVNKEKRYSSLSLACEYGNEEYVKALLQEFECDENSVKYLLLYKDRYGNSLYWANGQNDIVDYLLSAAKAIKDNNETLKKLLVPDEGYLPFNYAVCSDYNIDVVEKLINAAKDINDDYHTLKKMLLNDITQESALLDAVSAGYCDVIKLLLETAAGLGIEMLEKFIFAVDRDGKNAIQLMVECGHEEIFIDSFNILNEDKFHSLQKKVLETFDSISLSDRLNDAKAILISSIRFNRISNVKNILESAKKSNTSSKEKLGILLLADDGKDCYCNTLYIACDYGHKILIKDLLSYAISMDDEGATLKELITSPGFGNKTPFEALRKGYNHEIREIIESLILEAKNNNNEHVVNILQEVDSAQVINSNEYFTDLYKPSERPNKTFTNFKRIYI